MIQRVSGQVQRPVSNQTRSSQGQAGGFGAILQKELAKSSVQTPAQGVAFSKHAITRAEERGIQVTPDLMDQLAGSVVRAQAKGATNILAMDAEKAFIINVPHAKVITAITQDEMRESVFTNIDGAVFL